MGAFLYSLAGFLVAIAILVTVHEFGHFWVARKLGVTVLKFSIGFGKSIFTWKRKNDPTESGGLQWLVDRTPRQAGCQSATDLILWKLRALAGS